MNRRSFLGFACGGVVAAPAAVLMGEKAADYAHGMSAVRPLNPRVGVTGEVGPELVNSPIDPDLLRAIRQVESGRDERIRVMVRSAMDEALRQAEFMRRGQVMRG